MNESELETIRHLLESYLEKNGDSLPVDDVELIREALRLLEEFSREKVPKESIARQVVVAMIVQIISEIVGNAMR